MSFELPRPPQSVLFDMDGVLVDTFEAWVAVLAACRARRGMPALGAEAIRRSWGQGIAADCETLFPGAEPDALAREYDAEFVHHVGRVRAEPGAIAAVRAVRQAGIPCAVVTNSPRALAERLVAAIGLRDAFEALACGDEARGKPAPDLLHLAVARLGGPTDRAVMVGDTGLDVAAARAARVAVVGYRIAGGDARIESLHELPLLLGLG